MDSNRRPSLACQRRGTWWQSTAMGFASLSVFTRGSHAHEFRLLLSIRQRIRQPSFELTSGGSRQRRPARLHLRLSSADHLDRLVEAEGVVGVVRSLDLHQSRDVAAVMRVRQFSKSGSGKPGYTLPEPRAARFSAADAFGATRTVCSGELVAKDECGGCGRAAIVRAPPHAANPTLRLSPRARRAATVD
jgi:hypothetical protein